MIESTECFHSRLCHSTAKFSYVTPLPLRSPLSEEFVSDKEFRAEIVKLTAVLRVYLGLLFPSDVDLTTKTETDAETFCIFSGDFEAERNYWVHNACLPVLSLASEWLPSEEFSRNFIFGDLTKISLLITIFVKIAQSSTHFTLRRTYIYDLTQSIFCELRT